MKVFISWSGQLSKLIAEAFRQWIPGVIQAVKPYYSPDDITKGARWGTEIASELDASKVGIICLTRDNLDAPWIMFEAGALSKNIDKSKVCPLLFGIEPSDIQGPLVQFQAAKFSKDEMRKVIKMINTELGENGLSADVLDSVFEMWWPKLKTDIDKVIAETNGKEKKIEVRSERDILEEILDLTRAVSLTRDRQRRHLTIHPDAIQDFVRAYYNLAKETEVYAGHLSILSITDAIRKFDRPIKYLVNEADISSAQRDEFMEMFSRAELILRLVDNRTVNENNLEIDFNKPRITRRKKIIDPESDTK